MGAGTGLGLGDGRELTRQPASQATDLLGVALPSPSSRDGAWSGSRSGKHFRQPPPAPGFVGNMVARISQSGGRGGGSGTGSVYGVSSFWHSVALDFRVIL